MIEAVKSIPNNYITLKQRVKDKHAKTLLKLSKEVNFVFNYINDFSFQHILKKKQFLSAFDIAQYTKGCNDKKLGLDRIHLHSQSVQAIAEEYVLRRRQHKMSGHAHLAKGIPFLYRGMSVNEDSEI